MYFGATVLMAVLCHFSDGSGVEIVASYFSFAKSSRIFNIMVLISGSKNLGYVRYCRRLAIRCYLRFLHSTFLESFQSQIFKIFRTFRFNFQFLFCAFIHQ